MGKVPRWGNDHWCGDQIPKNVVLDGLNLVVLSCFPSPPMFFQVVPSLYLPICINLFLDLPRFICNLYLSVSISSKHELCTSTNYTSSICLILSHLVLSILSSYSSWSCCFLTFYLSLHGVPFHTRGEVGEAPYPILYYHFHSGTLSHSFLTFAVKSCLVLSDFISCNFSHLVSFCFAVSLLYLFLCSPFFWTCLNLSHPSLSYPSFLSCFVSCYLTL